VSFLAICILVICTPGPDTALTIRNALVGGRRGGVATALGVATGQLVWALAASTGLAALLTASEAAFHALRLAGAAYLVLLGALALRDAVRPTAGPPRAPGGSAGHSPPRRAFAQGLLSNLGNPKMAVFFAGLLPQFAPTGGGAFVVMLALGAVFAGMTLAWLTLYSLFVERARDLLLRSRARRALDAATGLALVALGLRLAAEDS
jgi:threonine/homoserine/homoserine lactone efflux protein